MARVTGIPRQHAVSVVDFPRLDGGLNLWEVDYRLAGNQSAEMKNLWWQDGVLQCRDGQVYLTETELGRGYTCFAELFWDNAFFHIGNRLFSLDMTALEPSMVERFSGVPENRGTFFRYNEWLIYKNRGGFYKIAYTPEGDAPFTVTDMAAEGYTPVLLLNADPTTGAGDTYQPENRLCARKTVRYNAAEGVTTYQLPVQAVDSVDRVVVDGVEQTERTDYTVNLEKGQVVFVTPPPVQEPPVNNTVEITFSKDNPDARKAILDCPYGAVYGGDTNLCVVLGGCEAQPNAFFWNGNDAFGMNLAYWPMTSYNLAGDAADGITGFGKQYGTLLVLKERSVGKVAYGVERLDDRDTVSLTYVSINDKIGCDLPWTIQLIENNIVFCNTSAGVHLVRDSSAALENNVVCVSRNVNGTAQRRGLLQDVQAVDRDAVCAFDDDNRYWVCANGHVYLWDYLLSSWQNPSWFYCDNVHGIAYLRAVGKSCHLNAAGRVTAFVRNFVDYGGAIEKVYQFPPQYFGTYDRLKDILYVLFTVRSDTDSVIRIQYQSDYETRYDLTDITTYSWRLAPRNLAYRCLSIRKFAHVARRKPGCGRVRHFSMRLSNNEPTQDLAILSAQIYFRYLGRDR